MSEPVTIVIPHFKAEILVDCLQSLYDHTPTPIHVIVVDDGPDAPSISRAREQFPQVEILRNETNLGFSASCNRGLDRAQTRYAVLLNDDTQVTHDWLRPLLEAAEGDSAVAACQPKLLSATNPGMFDYGGAAGGHIDHLGYTFCRGRIFGHVEADEGQYDESVPLFWACGSALFLRLSAVREVGLLDLDFFMHFEEIDLCWRLRLAGHRILAVPQSVVIHHSGFSLPPQSYTKSYLNHRNNLVTLYKNLPASRLLWLLPLRFCLEFLSSFLYFASGSWRLVPAPYAALLWMITHPFNLHRRRRASRGLRRAEAARDDRLAVYRGSILVQYFLLRRRTAAAIMPESPTP